MAVVTKAENENDEVDEVDEVDDESNADGTQDDPDDAGDGDEPVTFASKAEYAKAVNSIVQKRLKRNEQKYAPVVAERDTLKKRVDELSGAEKGKSAADQQIESLSKQVQDLLSYQTSTQRNELVREIAKDHGLPDEFLARVQGDDEDSITEDVEKLVELLNVSKATTRVTNPSKTSKPAGKDGKGGKGSDGKGGQDDDNKADPAALAKKVGRYGHRPVFYG